MTRDTYARDLATAAGTGAGEAVSRALRAEHRADVIEAQARIVKWIVALTGGAVVGMFVWLVAEVRSVATVAAERAAVVAEATVLRADRQWDVKIERAAEQAAAKTLAARDAQVDRLASHVAKPATP
jgi:hypothetical protein